MLFLFSISTLGFGNKVFNYSLFIDLSTLSVILLFVLLISLTKVVLPKHLYIFYTYILIHSLLNLHFELKQYLGLVIFSASIFMFVSLFRDRIFALIKIYFYFLFVLSLYTILQTILTIFSNVNLNNILFGYIFELRQNELLPEIFGLLPRAIGLSAEPAHFSIIMLPGIYMILSKFSGFNISSFRISKLQSFVIFSAFILSFSIVGYFGFLLCIVNLFKNNIIRSPKKLFTVTMVFLMMVISIFLNSQLIYKLTSLTSMSKDVTGYDYTTSDATGFALVSNIVVAKENLFNTRFLGSGINTHQYAYYKTIYSKFPESSLLNLLNVKDAGSLFIRIFSEFGIPGMFFFIFFLYKYKIKFNSEKDSEDMLLNNLSFIMILSFSFRNGEYLSPFLWFFIAVFYYTYKNIKFKLNF